MTLRPSTVPSTVPSTEPSTLRATRTPCPAAPAPLPRPAGGAMRRASAVAVLAALAALGSPAPRALAQPGGPPPAAAPSTVAPSDGAPSANAPSAAVPPTGTASTSPLPRLIPVPMVDPQRYAGTWYEIARLPNRFQARCVGDVVATYAPRADGAIDVVNRCRTESGAVDEAGGLATPQDPTNAKLKVSFLPAGLRWLPFFRGDYWVLALDAEYRWVMIGAPNRDFLWMLSRQPTLPREEFDALLAQAREMGFAAEQVVLTPQRAAPR